MAKIELSDVSSGYNRSRINTNFSDIQTELNEKVLYRDNPDGEANQMENDFDMNGHDILNVGTLDADSILIAGEDAVTTIAAYQQAASDSADAAAASESAAASSESSAASSAASAGASADSAEYWAEYAASSYNSTASTQYLIQSFDGSSLTTGSVIRTLGYSSADDGFPATLRKTGSAYETPSLDAGEYYNESSIAGRIVDAGGNEWSFVPSKTFTIDCMGGKPESGFDNGPYASSMINMSSRTLTFGDSGDDEYEFTTQLEMPSDGNVLVEGRGSERTKIAWLSDSGGLDWLDFSTNSPDITSLTTRGYTVRGTHETNQSFDSSFPMLILKTDYYKARDVTVTRSRAMGIAVRGALRADIQGCSIYKCARDGINTADCERHIIIGNNLEFIGDDAIACHNTVYRTCKGITIVGNNCRFTASIKALAGQNTVISGNTIQYFYHGGINLTSIAPDLTETEGVKAVLGTTVTGNVVADGVNRSVLDNEASGCNYIQISGAAAGVDSLSIIPGLQGTSPYDYMINVTGSAAVSAADIPPSNAMVFSGNVLMRTMPNSGLLSDLGLGVFYLPTGEYDVDLTANLSATYGSGVRITDGYIDNLTISDTIVHGMQYAVFAASGARLRNAKVSNLTAVDCDYGMFYSGADYLDIEFNGCTFDLDPYHRSTGRNADGSFSSNAELPVAFYDNNAIGMSCKNSTFKNIGRFSAGTNFDALIQSGAFGWENNVLCCDPSAVGYSASNKGIAYIPASGVRLKYTECDPTLSNYDEVYQQPIAQATTTPSPTKHVKNEFISNRFPTVSGTSGSQYVISGWLSLTVGSSNVLGTDWIEMRTLTGT